MATFRVKKTNRFTIISNAMLQRDDLSVALKGFLSYLYSLPTDWDINVNALSKKLKEGKTAIYTLISEAIAERYIIKTQSRDKKGRLTGTTYHVFEEPQPLDPASEAPRSGNPKVDKPTLQSNKSTKKQKSKATAGGESEVTSIAAADSFFSDHQTPPHAIESDSADQVAITNQVIHQTLSDAQCSIVQQKVAGLTIAPPLDAQALLAGIIQELESPNSFSEAGQCFYKKLNTIVKQIRLGQWLPPLPPEAPRKQNKQQALLIQFNTLLGEKASIERMIQYACDEDTAQLESLSGQLESTKSKLRSLRKQLDQVQPAASRGVVQ